MVLKELMKTRIYAAPAVKGETNQLLSVTKPIGFLGLGHRDLPTIIHFTYIMIYHIFLFFHFQLYCTVRTLHNTVSAFYKYIEQFVLKGFHLKSDILKKLLLK